MFYNETDDVGYIYGTGSDLAVFNCANSTATNCSYIDPNEFYGASSLDPEDEERLQNIIRVVVPVGWLTLLRCIFLHPRRPCVREER
ncbi:hypothetical protein RUM44_010779 [Polyplax serrata]|uniref:Uncharacterized protein n=1 Tax=Polyplax serrata TaxID=468196 RepID=A0ABR1APY1_POLSC